MVSRLLLLLLLIQRRDQTYIFMAPRILQLLVYTFTSAIIRELLLEKLLNIDGTLLARRRLITAIIIIIRLKAGHYPLTELKSALLRIFHLIFSFCALQVFFPLFNLYLTGLITLL